jgi:hypothetical protein
VLLRTVQIGFFCLTIWRTQRIGACCFVLTTRQSE